MKKITTLSLAFAMIALSFVGCSNTSTPAKSTSQQSAAKTKSHDATGGSPGSGDVSTRGARGPM